MTPLRFFRRYNKWILAIGVSILMVAFLIQPALTMFGPKPANQVIGTIGNEDVTLGAHLRANRELEILRGVHPLLGISATHSPGELGGNSPSDAENAIKWLLMQHSAHAMGLSASNDEVDQLLRYLEINDDRFAAVSNTLRVGPDDIRQALQIWVVVQHYKELVLGRAHVSMSDRLSRYAEALQFLRFQFLPGYLVSLDSSYGTPRISRSVLEHFLHDQRAKVEIAVVRISADHFLSEIALLDPKVVEELFESYKDELPGQGKPYGFGYRLPDRVRLEYLAFPISRLRSVIQVDEADLLKYYDENKEEFETEVDLAGATDDQSEGATTALADSTPVIKPYDEVRDQIVARKSDQLAQELGEKMVNEARAIFNEHNRVLKEKGGYKLTDDFTPLVLEEVAEQLKRQFGVLPDVVSLDDRWLTRQTAANLPDIGAGILRTSRPVLFADYVFSVKELVTEDNELLTHRLQAKIASAPLYGEDGSRYIFRILQADRSSTLETIDLIREQVESDAKKLAAYERLVADALTWRTRAQTEELDDLAQELSTTVLRPEPFRKRQPSLRGVPEAANIEGLGQHPELVDRVFELVQNILKEGDFSGATTAQRVDAIALDDQLSLYLVRLDDYTAITPSEFARDAGSPYVAAEIAQFILSDNQAPDPLSTEALSERVGYEPTPP